MNLDQLGVRMEASVDSCKKEIAGLRTGRAATAMLEPVMVDAYGSMMPLNQVGSISVPEPRLLTIQVWDKGLVKAVEKAITNAGLGLNPQPDGALVRVPVPELSQERRLELVKVAGKYAEQGRISVRNIRRDAMDEVKKEQKAGTVSEDAQKDLSDQIQTLTDQAIKKIDDVLAKKEKEITTV